MNTKEYIQLIHKFVEDPTYQNYTEVKNVDFGYPCVHEPTKTLLQGARNPPAFTCEGCPLNTELKGLYFICAGSSNRNYIISVETFQNYTGVILLTMIRYLAILEYAETGSDGL